LDIAFLATRWEVFSSTWSPDGKRALIAFSYWDDYRSETRYVLRAVNGDGSSAVDIVSNGKFDAEYMATVWSPDGGMLATRYEYASSGDYGVFIIKSDGGDSGGRRARRLPGSDISDRPRFWSLDGKWVIAVSSNDNQLYALEVDGSRRVPLAQVTGMKFYDERYYPWRITETAVCRSSSFWDCL
jgi:Tol biopolymer transport system component